MSRHLSADQIAQYRNKTLASSDLLIVQGHIGGCDECRKLLLESGVIVSAVRAIDDQLELPHLSDQQMEDYVDGKLPVDERNSVETHLKRCARCRSEEEDLREFKASFAAEYARAALQSNFSWLTATAAILVISLVAPVGFYTIQLWNQQRVVDLTLSDERLKVVRKALESQNIEVPSFINTLVGEKQTLMGDEQKLPFDLLRPVGTAVDSSQPFFEWQPLAGAQSYQVRIFNTKFDLIEESTRLSSQSWIPTTPLKSGEIYTWQVSAWIKHREIISPVAPYAQARFLVLDPSKHEPLQREIASYGGSHLLRGACYARYGLLDAAESEFRLLLEKNSRSALPRQFLKNLQSVRSGRK